MLLSVRDQLDFSSPCGPRSRSRAARARTEVVELEQEGHDAFAPRDGRRVVARLRGAQDPARRRVGIGRPLFIGDEREAAEGAGHRREEGG